MQYESLLRWLFNEVVLPANSSCSPDQELLALCRKIDSSYKLKHCTLESLSCGIECHHEFGNTIDYGIFIDANNPYVSTAFTAPSWWTFLISRQQCADQFIPYCYSLEFDTAAGLKPSLAGIFQTVNPPERFSPSEQQSLISKLLDHLGQLEFTRSMLNDSQCLALCLQQLGIPEQVGIMSGRGDVIKLVISTSGWSKQTVANILASFQQSHGLPWPELSNQFLITYLSNPESNSTARISIDIDLAHDRFLPRLGIELANTAMNPGEITPPLIDFCTDAASISPDSIRSCLALSKRLPTGYQRAAKNERTLHGVSLQSHQRTAHLSHLKVVLAAGRKPLLKSYVDARQIRLHAPTPADSLSPSSP
jgi:hypothetical protein